MNQKLALTNLRQTWEDPEKELHFEQAHPTKGEPYQSSGLSNNEKKIFSLLLFMMLFNTNLSFFEVPESFEEMRGYVNALLFFILLILVLVEVSFSEVSSTEVSSTEVSSTEVSSLKPSVKLTTEKIFCNKSLLSDAKETERPHYHEVIKVEKPDLTQAPPEFRDLPETDKLVFVETKVLESSSADHQDSTRWVLHLEPEEPISIQPGDHLISLYGNKKQDHYALHAQSCRLMYSQITIAPKSILLSLQGYLDVAKKQDKKNP